MKMIFKSTKGKNLNKNLGKSQLYTIKDLLKSNNSVGEILASNFKEAKKGFTIAEVLITLSIIGIVASMVLPTIYYKSQKEIYITKLKKNYSIINQALSQFAAENGCAGDLRCTGFFNPTGSSLEFGEAFVKYFNIMKNCKTSDDKGCMPSNASSTYVGSARDTNLDHSNPYIYYKFISTDGTAFTFINHTDSCANHGPNNMAQVCGEIYFDVNGPLSGPNNLGRDIFGFWITNGKGPLLYPHGGKDDKFASLDRYWQNNGCLDDTNKNGWYCPARIMEENWQMKY